MAKSRAWSAYSATYRAPEIAFLANWIQAGQSGAVVGLPGCGRSNLLGFLCYRPDVIRTYLPAETGPLALVPVDLNNLPATDSSTLYRVILRAFYSVCHHLEPELQESIKQLYLENRAIQDPFVTQSALLDVLQLFQNREGQITLVLNHFDRFCELMVQLPQPDSTRIINTLRGIRDSFKDTVCYLAGMSQEVAYLPDPNMLGEMYILLDSYICWVGAMDEADARQLIEQETGVVPIIRSESGEQRRNPLTESEIRQLLALTGGFPALLKAACHWWLFADDKLDIKRWRETLMAELPIRYRLEELWTGLTQEEQLVLSEMQRLQTRAAAKAGQKAHQDGHPWFADEFKRLHKQYGPILHRLAHKGLCRQVNTTWHISGELIAACAAEMAGQGRGKIWLDDKTGELYQGRKKHLDLTHLEGEVLRYLVKHPRMKHTVDNIIDNAWPEEQHREGIADEVVYQIVSKLRRKIEPNPGKPCYIITWRGQPKGGYQFFPEGKPKFDG